jgi:hypothetical protein
MKQLLIPLLAGFGALLPITPSQAAGPVEETRGGSSVDKTFTLVVTDRSSVQKKGLRPLKNVRVPGEWPDLKKGDTVTFTIGRNGQLKGPGFSIRHRDDRGRTGFYYNTPSFDDTEGKFANVTSNGNGRPRKATVKFAKLSFSGIIPVTNTVQYEFERNP